MGKKKTPPEKVQTPEELYEIIAKTPAFPGDGDQLGMSYRQWLTGQVAIGSLGKAGDMTELSDAIEAIVNAILWANVHRVIDQEKKSEAE